VYVCEGVRAACVYVCVTNTVHLPGAGWHYTGGTASPWRLSAAVELALYTGDTLLLPRDDTNHYVVCAPRISSPTHCSHHRHLYTRTQLTAIISNNVVIIADVSRHRKRKRNWTTGHYTYKACGSVLRSSSASCWPVIASEEL